MIAPRAAQAFQPICPEITGKSPVVQGITARICSRERASDTPRFSVVRPCAETHTRSDMVSRMRCGGVNQSERRLLAGSKEVRAERAELTRNSSHPAAQSPASEPASGARRCGLLAGGRYGTARRGLNPSALNASSPRSSHPTLDQGCPPAGESSKRGVLVGRAPWPLRGDDSVASRQYGLARSAVRTAWYSSGISLA